MALLVSLRKRVMLVSKISGFILDVPDETIQKHLENEELLYEAIRTVFRADLTTLPQLRSVIPTAFTVPDIYYSEKDLKRPSGNDFANAILHPAIKILDRLPPRTRSSTIGIIRWYLDYWEKLNATAKAGRTLS